VKVRSRSGRRQPDERSPFGNRSGARKNREPAQARAARANRKRAAARVGGGLQGDAFFGFAVERVGQQVAHGRRHRLILARGEPEVFPLGIFDQDSGVDGRCEVGGQRLRAAAGSCDASQRLGVAQQSIDPSRRTRRV